MAQEPHSPDEQIRRTVEAMVAGGIPQEDVARVVGVDAKTLRKYYREELDTAATKANAKVAQTLYQKAINGDTTAIIWWTKGRMGWAEKRDYNQRHTMTYEEALDELDSEGEANQTEVEE